MKRKWLFPIALVFFLIVFIVSGFYLARYYLESFRQKMMMNALELLVEQAAEQTLPPEIVVPDPTLQQEEEGAPMVEQSPYVHITDPVTGEVRRLLKKYASLYLENTDTVGWISIEGTRVNYPVMQTPDSPDYYLYVSFHHEYARHGSIYAREQCDVFAPSDNITIYGHRMGDGSMFNDLLNYQKESYFREHPIITFDTIEEHYDYEILSVFLTTATAGEGFSYHLFVDADTPEEFDRFVDTCKTLSLYETGVNAQYGDKLITLSTCEYSQTNGRLVVVARRIDPDTK